VLERLRPKSALGRAVLPVVGGLAFFVLVAAATWGIAATLSANSDRVNERLAPLTFEVGNTEYLAGLIADDGPLLFQGLIGTDAKRSLVLDHTGDLVDKGWRIRLAHPADREPTCAVTQVRHSRQFIDCDGRTLEVDDLARPVDILPIVGDTVIIDLRVANASTTSPSSSPSTTPAG
jgi:hypothetical protein